MSVNFYPHGNFTRCAWKKISVRIEIYGDAHGNLRLCAWKFTSIPLGTEGAEDRRSSN
jgi:hypothetical protein